MLIWAAATAAERQGCACEEALLMLWLVLAVGVLSLVGVVWLVAWDARRGQRGAGK